MKTTELIEKNTSAHPTFATSCLASCQRLIARIEKAKHAILVEFRQTRESHEQLLRLALNEAEALAWQTGFPHLVFPTLALEKAQQVVAWSAHQQSVQRTHSRFTLAA